MLRKCPLCNRLSFAKKIGKEFVREENIKMVETLTEPGFRGEINTKVERLVPGKRLFYNMSYLCRRCGKQYTKSVWKDSKK